MQIEGKHQEDQLHFGADFTVARLHCGTTSLVFVPWGPVGSELVVIIFTA